MAVEQSTDGCQRHIDGQQISETSDDNFEVTCGVSIRNTKLELLNKIRELSAENFSLKKKIKLLQENIAEQQHTQGMIDQMRHESSQNIGNSYHVGLSFGTVKEEQDEGLSHLNKMNHDNMAKPWQSTGIPSECPVVDHEQQLTDRSGIDDTGTCGVKTENTLVDHEDHDLSESSELCDPVNLQDIHDEEEVVKDDEEIETCVNSGNKEGETCTKNSGNKEKKRKRVRKTAIKRLKESSHKIPRPYVCNVCNKTLSNKELYIVHMNNHEGIPTYTCKYCDRKYRSRSGLGHHILQAHESGRRKKTSCNVCGKQVVSIRAHRRLHDPNDRPFQCAECGKGFISRQACDIHMRDHTGERPFRCQVCDKDFKTKGSLKEHSRVHTGDGHHICDICGVGLSSSSSLNSHKLWHTGERPFSCTICKKTFNKNGALKTHMKSHSDARPFICEVCGKGFKLKTILKDHMPVHTGERKHKCLYCEDRFKKHGHRNTHMKLVHKHVMKPRGPH